MILVSSSSVRPFHPWRRRITLSLYSTVAAASAARLLHRSLSPPPSPEPPSATSARQDIPLRPTPWSHSHLHRFVPAPLSKLPFRINLSQACAARGVLHLHSRDRIIFPLCQHLVSRMAKPHIFMYHLFQLLYLVDWTKAKNLIHRVLLIYAASQIRGHQLIRLPTWPSHEPTKSCHLHELPVSSSLKHLISETMLACQWHNLLIWLVSAWICSVLYSYTLTVTANPCAKMQLVRCWRIVAFLFYLFSFSSLIAACN